jgi:hypothetical protein
MRLFATAISLPFVGFSIGVVVAGGSVFISSPRPMDRRFSVVTWTPK